MAEESESRIIPGVRYTRETLPSLSPEAQAIVDRIRARAKAHTESPEGRALKARAEEAKKKGGVAAYIGVMLGAKGY